MKLENVSHLVFNKLNEHEPLTKEYNLAKSFTGKVNEIKLMSKQKDGRNYFILVMELLSGDKLAKELFGDYSKGGESSD